METPQVLAPTTYTTYPRFEGSNISTWIGFKHVMYMMEEALLQHFRENGYAPQRLYEEYGLCFEIVDAAARILHAVHMDDRVFIEVNSLDSSDQKELRHKIEAFVEKDDKRLKVASSKTRVLLRRDSQAAAKNTIPQLLERFSHNDIHRPEKDAHLPTTLTTSRSAEFETSDADIVKRLTSAESNAFVWRWRVPYFYCHFTERLQHSGYLRLMEEVVDLFLASRGLSIRTMLDTRHWIPVVPSAQVEILREAFMEETLYTVYHVEDIFKGLTYTARMECYVLRNNELVHTATGRIVHGYAKILGPSEWELISFDEATIAALRGNK